MDYEFMVAVGKVQRMALAVGAPVQLTDFPANVIAWDTAVTIVRDGPNKGNIVVSYGLVDFTKVTGAICTMQSSIIRWWSNLAELNTNIRRLRLNQWQQL